MMIMALIEMPMLMRHMLMVLVKVEDDQLVSRSVLTLEKIGSRPCFARRRADAGRRIPEVIQAHNLFLPCLRLVCVAAAPSLVANSSVPD